MCIRDRLLEQVVEVITSDKKVWVDTMLQEEHSLSLEGPDPKRSAWLTFLAFLIAGFVPVTPFIINLLIDNGMPNPFLWSAIATAITFFAIGIFKAKVVSAKKIRSGIETVAIGGMAATMAYGIGWLLRGVADNI